MRATDGGPINNGPPWNIPPEMLGTPAIASRSSKPKSSIEKLANDINLGFHRAYDTEAQYLSRLGYLHYFLTRPEVKDSPLKEDIESFLESYEASLKEIKELHKKIKSIHAKIDKRINAKLYPERNQLLKQIFSEKEKEVEEESQ